MVIGISGRIKYMKGSSTVPEAGGLRYILQLNNNQGKYTDTTVSKRWPAVESAYKQWYRKTFGKLPLGVVQSTTVQSDTIVVSMLVTEDESTKVKDLEALEKCLVEVAKQASYDGATAHIQKFKFKNWEAVEKLLKDTLVKAGVNVTVYE